MTSRISISLLRSSFFSLSSVVAASACLVLTGCAGPASSTGVASKPTLRAPLPSGVQFAPTHGRTAPVEPDEGPAAIGNDAGESLGGRSDVQAIRNRILQQSQAFDPTAIRRPDRSVPAADADYAPKVPSDRGTLNDSTVPELESPRSRPPVRLPPHEAGYASARRAPASHPPEGSTAAIAAGKPTTPTSETPQVFNKDETPGNNVSPSNEITPAAAGSGVSKLADPVRRQPVAGSATPPAAPGAGQPGSIRVGGPTDEPPAQASGTIKPSTVDVYPASEDIASRADRRVREAPQDLAAQVDHQLVTLLKNEPAFSTPSAAALQREDRELIGALIDGIAVFRAGLASDSTALMPKKAKPLLDMAERIRGLTKMNIPTLALCSRVSGFGVYEPLTPRFRAGLDQPVIIYCEVENFHSRLNDRQMYETRLSLEVTLFAADGSPIWSDKNSVPPDLSRNRRHDFFVIKHMVLPRSLALGRYLLKVSVNDENIGEVAEQHLYIMMSAQ